MKKMRLNMAFTLIELLIVAGIIAVLAAILFPVFAYVREQGRASSCLSNVRQLGASILLYANDYDQHCPHTDALPDASWAERIQPYVKDVSIYVCSSASSDDFGGHQPDNTVALIDVSYAYNLYIGGITPHNPRSPNPLPNRSFAGIARPADTVLLTEGATTAQAGVSPAQWKTKQTYAVWASTLLADTLTSGVIMAEAAGPVAPKARHHGKASVAYADGHAKSLPVEAFYAAPGQKVVSDRIAGYSPCLDPERGCAP